MEAVINRQSWMLPSKAFRARRAGNLPMGASIMMGSGPSRASCVQGRDASFFFFLCYLACDPLDTRKNPSSMLRAP